MKKATALIMVLVVMIIVGIGTTALLQAMISYTQMNITSMEKTEAWYLAEAGVQYGLMQLRNGDTTSPVTITTEKYVITIYKTPNGSSYDVTADVVYAGL
jgi:Tfp pilus assembly protein PilX